MPEFIPAAKLKGSYEVFGHFYSVDLKSGERIDCRSVLELITPQRKPSNLGLLAEQLPDAIFIMMNPGSSEPLEEVHHIVPEDGIGQLEISLVRTKPDITQYQVMRAMHYCGWAHVRVLNLSDMRDPQSGKFVERYSQIERSTGFTAHSLFSDERACELARKLVKNPQTPVVCAWGVSPDLEPLIDRCLARVSKLPGLTGLLKPETRNKYFHPLPTLQSGKIKWVDDMVALINS